MAAEAGLTSSGIGKVCFWLHGKSRRNRFFCCEDGIIDSGLSTAARVAGGDTAGIYADNHNDVTLKFGGAGDGEVQGKAVVVWRGEGRKRTGEQGRACRALRGGRDRVPMRSRFRVKFWYADLGVSQSRGTVARARAGSR